MTSETEIQGAMERFGIGREEAATVEYLGDGVYATFDGYQVSLRLLPGPDLRMPTWIALEPPVMRSLIDYATRHSAVSA